MPDPRIPIIKAGSFGAGGGLLSWVGESHMGAAYVRNKGPDPAFMAFDAIPGAATTGDGRVEIQVNEAINLDDIKFDELGFITGLGDTAVIEAIGLLRPGSAGTGIQG